VALFQIVATALLVILCTDMTFAVEKQIKLEDIEREYSSTKPALQQQPQQQQQQQQQQLQQDKPQGPVSDLEYTGHQQLQYPVQQQLQYHVPPTAGAVALYLPSSGLSGNYLGIVPDVTYVPPQQQSIPIAPQQLYLSPGGYNGFQFVQVPPPPPPPALIYSNQQLAAPEVAHPSKQNQAPVAPAPQHDFRVSQFAYQQAPAAGSAAYRPQQQYNPIPKELQSYTTIPAAVYQGKEPQFVYDQQPTVSLTHEGQSSSNALQQHQQQPKTQRLVFTAGVKSGGAASPKAFASGGGGGGGGSFLVPTRHHPGAAVSYSSYRQGPGPF
jgi:hypothetical protein